MGTTNIRLGDAIRRVRILRGLTQKELAQKTALTINFLSLLENGHRNAGVEQLEVIARGLQVPLSSLFILGEQADKTDPANARLLKKLQGIIFAAYEVLAEIDPNEDWRRPSQTTRLLPA
jgi:transcriptional regulator with XRE-family HTH domain